MEAEIGTGGRGGDEALTERGSSVQEASLGTSPVEHAIRKGLPREG